LPPRQCLDFLIKESDICFLIKGEPFIFYNMNNLLLDLTCPITLELFEYPISLPCCGKTIDRDALAQCMQSNSNCPLCREDLGDFDAMCAVKNVTIAGLVESYREINQPTPQPLDCAHWTAEITAFGAKSELAELRLSVSNSAIIARPNLFIAVVDASGSMSGNPWEQVRSALIHMTSIMFSGSAKMEIIKYESSAQVIKFSNLVDALQTIRGLKASGGTNFMAAFQEVAKLIRSYYNITDKNDSKYFDARNISGINIAFLTDGDSYENIERLTKSFTDLLEASWKGPLCVHSIGFGKGCNKDLLELLRKCGNIDGMFRYAEPDDSSDVLCGKLQGLFDFATGSANIDLGINLNSDVWHFLDGSNSQVIPFPIGDDRCGEKSIWLAATSDGLDLPTNDFTINLPGENQRLSTGGENQRLSTGGENQRLSPRGISLTNKTSCENSAAVLQRWISEKIDELAAEILALVGVPAPELYYALIEQKINKILEKTTRLDFVGRLNFLSTQIVDIRCGRAVNVGKLSDLRFSSQFVELEKTPPPAGVTVVKSVTKSRYEQSISGMSFEVKGHELEQIRSNFLTSTMLMGTIHAVDSYGNTSLHIAAYLGLFAVVSDIVNNYPGVDINAQNNRGETAFTVAVKSRGYDKILRLLHSKGAMVDGKRFGPLIEFAINAEFRRTAAFLSEIKASDAICHVSKDMKAEFVEYTFTEAIKKGSKFNVAEFLDVALFFGLYKMASELIHDFGAVPTIGMLMAYCIPKRPDSPQVGEYLELAKLLLSARPELADEVDPTSGDTLLIRSSDSGNLPLVQFFLTPSNVNAVNLLGNSALWVSCAKRWPCIISELIGGGANIDQTNHKGNPPISCICQRGPIKIAELLISMGCGTDFINKNGDTILTLCARNGQPELLRFFLDYVDSAIIEHVPKIDGFNVLFAAVEANQVACIRVLLEGGVMTLEGQRTARDNEIIQWATPLHLAAYYGRTEAARVLLEFGAHIDEVDGFGQTPMHLAIIQKQAGICRLLKQYGPNMNILDMAGMSALSYCAGNKEIRAMLTNSLVAPLMRLCRGGERNEIDLIQILRERSAVRGCFESCDILDITDEYGSTPLIEAVKHCRTDLVEFFAGIGADPRKKANNGISANMWAKWIGVKQLPTTDSEAVDFCEKMGAIRKISPANAFVVFFNKLPKSSSATGPTGIKERHAFIKNIWRGGDEMPPIDLDKNGVINLYNLESLSTELANLILLTKFKTVGQLMGDVGALSVQELFIINLWAGSAAIAINANNFIMSGIGDMVNRQLVSTLVGGLGKLENYAGEMYTGVETLDRAEFMPGSEIGYVSMLSGSTIWRNATNQVTDFDKRGTVFIIQSKTGKYLAENAEVIYSGRVRFVVAAWYKGNIIALGQKNIRATAYAIKPEEMEQYEGNKVKSLIIELIEI
jgi:ankyrin repeat protein/uncharacterized protein YegL